MRLGFHTLLGLAVCACSSSTTEEQGRVQGLGVTPIDANGTDTLTCAWTGLDGSPTASISWRVNGASVYGEESETLGPDWFKKGDRVACVVTPDFRGAQGEISNVVTIQNSPPVLLSAAMTPEAPTERDLLYASGEAEDPDRGDAESLIIHYQWMLNGQQVGFNDYVLGPSWWKEGDRVSVYVSVGDGVDRSPAQLIGPVIIVNSLPGPPEIEVVGQSNGDLSCERLEPAEELDENDTLTYSTRWREFGNVILEGQETLPADFVREGGEYICEMWASDEEGPGEAAIATYTMEGDPLRYRWAFNDAGAMAGSGLATVSDVDGDGLREVVVSTPGVTGQKVEMGGAVVLGSSSLGAEAVLGDLAIQAQILGGKAQAFLGDSLATTPDYDGDGIEEILLSSPMYSVWDTEGGLATSIGSSVYLDTPTMNFNAEGATQTAVGIVWGGSDGEGFGRSVLGMDLNQDNMGDMLVAIHTDDVQTPGSLRVISGEHLLRGGPLYMEHTIAFISGLPGYFGTAMTLMPDADGDGIEELVMSSPQLNNASGAVMVLGSQSIQLYDSIENRVETSVNSQALRLEGSSGDSLGEALAGGVWESYSAILMGAPSAAGGRGEAYLMAPYQSDRWGDAVRFEGSSGSSLGHSVAFVGDTDWDGDEEVAIGAPNASASYDEAGAVYLFALPDLVAGSVYDAGDAIRVVSGESEGEHSGTSILGLQDFNGDGQDDLLVGAANMDAPLGWNEGGVSIWVSP